MDEITQKNHVKFKIFKLKNMMVFTFYNYKKYKPNILLIFILDDSYFINKIV